MAGWGQAVQQRQGGVRLYTEDRVVLGYTIKTGWGQAIHQRQGGVRLFIKEWGQAVHWWQGGVRLYTEDRVESGCALKTEWGQAVQWRQWGQDDMKDLFVNAIWCGVSAELPSSTKHLNHSSNVWTPWCKITQMSRLAKDCRKRTWRPLKSYSKYHSSRTLTSGYEWGISSMLGLS